MLRMCNIMPDTNYSCSVNPPITNNYFYETVRFIAPYVVPSCQTLCEIICDALPSIAANQALQTFCFDNEAGVAQCFSMYPAVIQLCDHYSNDNPLSCYKVANYIINWFGCRGACLRVCNLLREQTIL